MVGRVIAASASVVDVAFAEESLPPINHALHVDWEGPHRLILEVQQHVDTQTVRCVAMQSTAGLTCGTTVRDAGAPILAPAGDAAQTSSAPSLGARLHIRPVLFTYSSTGDSLPV